LKGGLLLIFLPVIPIVALLAIVGGSASLCWYYSMDSEEQDLANELAIELFQKTVEQLNRGQSKTLKQRFFV
jgi:hypothetical protein